MHVVGVIPTGKTGGLLVSGHLLGYFGVALLVGWSSSSLGSVSRTG